MTKIAENGQNKEGFAVVSSQMLLGRKILCRDTVMWCRGIRKGQGPLSDPFEGPQKAPKSLIITINQKPLAKSDQKALAKSYHHENRLKN